MHPLAPRVLIAFLYRTRLLAAAAVFVLLAGCGSQGTDAERAAREGRLLINVGADPEELDPHTTTGIPEYKIEMELFEGLVREDASGEIIPGAAESWDVSDDGRTYTFQLRQDARWSNGDPVVAADWVYSFRRALTPELGNTYGVMYDWIVGAHAYRTGASSDFDTVGVRALDEHTLQIELTDALSYFIPMLVLHTFYPVHRPSVEVFGAIGTRGSGWTRPGKLVGNGPFVLTEWIPGQRLIARPNPHYWGAEDVRLREIHFFTIASGEVEERSYRAGQLHVTYTLPNSKIPVWRERTERGFRNERQLAVYYYGFNVSYPPFNDVRVRQALSMAIDRKLLVERVTRGGEDPAWHFLPTFSNGYDDADAPRMREDAGEARRLLAEAGFPGGKGFPVSALLYNTLESNRDIAEAIQQMWRGELGIDVQLQNQEWKVYLATRKMGDFQIARSGWAAAYNDVSVFAELMLSDNGNNHTRWGSERYDNLVRAAAVERDPARRSALYGEADQLLLDEAPVIPLYFYRKSYLVRPEVRGWRENLMDHHPLREVWLEAGEGN